MLFWQKKKNMCGMCCAIMRFYVLQDCALYDD